MRGKVLNILVFIASFIGYLVWPGNNHIFIFEAEFDIFLKLFSKPLEVFHPFIILPFLGQVILLYTLFQKQPSKLLSFVGIGSLAILMVFLFIVGLLGYNFKIILSTLPFIVVSVLYVRYLVSRNGNLG